MRIRAIKAAGTCGEGRRQAGFSSQGSYRDVNNLEFTMAQFCEWIGATNRRDWSHAGPLKNISEFTRKSNDCPLILAERSSKSQITLCRYRVHPPLSGLQHFATRLFDKENALFAWWIQDDWVSHFKNRLEARNDVHMLTQTSKHGVRVRQSIWKRVGIYAIFHRNFTVQKSVVLLIINFASFKGSPVQQKKMNYSLAHKSTFRELYVWPTFQRSRTVLVLEIRSYKQQHISTYTMIPSCCLNSITSSANDSIWEEDAFIILMTLMGVDKWY